MLAPSLPAATETQPDIQSARTRAEQAQQQARDEQKKAQAAAQRAAAEHSPGAGYGAITYKAGAYYWGQKNAAGRRDGYGVFAYAGGRCECRFAADAPVGAGVIVAASGDRYEGELGGGPAGSAAGYGVYHWANGRRYEGQFAADKPNGAGVLVDALGASHAGLWKNGSLVDSHAPSLAESIEHAGAPAAGTGTDAVPMASSGGGTYTIPVTINGAVRIPFIVDSGAGDVVLPEDVVRVLLRAGTLDKSDLLGRIKYIVADGSAHYGLRLHIRELQVGDRIVRDVTASVSPERSDPLLGQTFLSRFGAWTIDNQTHRLVLQSQ